MLCSYDRVMFSFQSASASNVRESKDPASSLFRKRLAMKRLTGVLFHCHSQALRGFVDRHPRRSMIRSVANILARPLVDRGVMFAEPGGGQDGLNPLPADEESVPFPKKVYFDQPS